tara:strand:+ start:462 stop:1151 length:690 start_codon:yes stop_codon:yes gene_type:complete
MTEKAISRTRTVRSFVYREGRMTPGQKQAYSSLNEVYSIDLLKPIDWLTLFGTSKSITLEIGFGDGQSLVDLAQKHPDQGFVGIEPHRPGIGQLMLALQKNGISNVRIIEGDAADIVPTRIPKGLIESILVFFPDPWPKKRHHKRRLLSYPFINILADRLKVNGVLHIATDWNNYAHEILDAVNCCPILSNTSSIGKFSQRPSSRLLTKYERRGISLGHDIFDIIASRT